VEALYETWSPRALAVLRIVSAVLFIQHGTAKIFGIPHVVYFDGLQLFSLAGLAGVLEVFGGLAILVGLFTRPIAFVLSGEMAVAYFIAHAPSGLLPLLNGGEVAALYSWLFLYLAVAGGGTWSLDALRAADPRITRRATA
jgi:putative oxidoreductase